MKIIVYKCKRCHHVYTVIDCTLENCPHCTYSTLEKIKKSDKYILYDKVNQTLI